MPDAPARPIVVGGGIAGVVAALHLAARGTRPILLEAHPNRLGGRWRGGTPAEYAILVQDGKPWRFPAEHGIHGLWGQYHNLRATLDRFLDATLDQRLTVAERQEWVYAAGGQRVAHRVELGRVVTHTLVPAPFHYLSLFVRPAFLRVMTPLEVIALPWIAASLQMALAFDPLVRPADAETLSRLRLRTFFFGWPPRLRSMVAALARSGLFADPDQAPLGGFIAFLRFYTLLRRDSQRFHYLRQDPETAVFAPLLTALRQAGGEVILGAHAHQVERVGERSWRVQWRRVEGETHWTEPGPLVLATDAPATRTLLLASPDTHSVAARHVEWPPGLSNAAVRLWWSEEPSNGTYAEAAILGGDFTGDNVFWLHRIQTQSPFAAWAAESGGSACEVHVYGPDDVLEQPDAAILARVVLDVRRAYPRLRDARLLHSTLQRNPPAHTLFNVGSTSRHLEVDAPWPGVWLCGDWVRYPTPALFLERATVTGIAAANGVLEDLGLPDPWPILPVNRPEWLAGALSALWRAFRRG